MHLCMAKILLDQCEDPIAAPPRIDATPMSGGARGVGGGGG